MKELDLNSPEMQAIIDKVEKLLRLAGNNDNEHQASAATAKAQELLAAYNLDMTTIETKAGAGSGKREDAKLAGGLYKWQRDLWQKVAELNFCLYWSLKGLKKGQKYEHRVLGRTVNILSTRMMAEYLEQAIERITREQYGNSPSLYFSKAGIAYREGMADRIGERLNERRRELEREAEKTASEERARRNHPAYSGPTANAITIVDVKKSEWDANQEFIWDAEYGAGEWAARQARLRALSAEYKARQQAALAEADRFMLEHPEEYAAAKAVKEAANKKSYDEWVKREARNARRRTGSYRCYGPDVRHSDYYSGHDRGGSVSLDRQVSKSSPKKIS